MVIEKCRAVCAERYTSIAERPTLLNSTQNMPAVCFQIMEMQKDTLQDPQTNGARVLTPTAGVVGRGSATAAQLGVLKLHRLAMHPSTGVFTINSHRVAI